ncbi:hypothetical protein EJ05DRAFT_488479 [Pseudovirgaria hyperparasitica]|uniref:Uncharacterized protein n=1 Tax=Pseudovirgaria hyperparasitica TaxID=470096 RepID=A0A6A6VYN2_9PEZI|nr:uncharacterized protein EJ05DRAFT_488479 [Pseudovirgaria hyperparasitica]KAF2755768.1 hypothetical protein EJ05DRAFT_488479 [Pseudovirgaria hyperparasitica]
MRIEGPRPRSVGSRSTPSITPPVRSPASFPGATPAPPEARESSMMSNDWLSSFMPPQCPTQHQETQLMAYYQQYTFRTFATLDYQNFQHVWEQVVPNQAQHHNFLKHAVLSIAALHSAHSNPIEAAHYAFLARSHHEHAMQLFYSVGTTITAENATAVLGFAFFQVIYRFGSPFVPGLPSPLDVVDAFNQVIVVLSLFWRLLPEARPLIASTSVTRLVSQADFVPAYTPGETYSHLFEAIETANNLSSDPLADKTAYQASTLELRRLFAIPFVPVSWSLILSWPIRAPGRIMELLRLKRPLALVHLAYWCVPIHHACSAPEQWFLGGWSRKMVLYIARCIEAEYRGLMKWPLDQIGVNVVPGSQSASEPSTSMSPPVMRRMASDR